MPKPEIILRTKALTRRFQLATGLKGRLARRQRSLTAVDGVDLSIARGQIYAIVGESGSGKSTLGRMLLGLLPPTEGTVEYRGRVVSHLRGAEAKHFRRAAQVVFQDPYASLNPRMRIGAQIREPLDIHRIGPPAGREARVLELLERVGLGPEHARSYPAELSGGQRQRVGIALALALSPEIIVADEPTSALDVSVQAQVLNLLADLQRDEGLTIVFITHDLGVVRHFCDRVAVMYLGRIVEEAETGALFADPRHPYTRILFEAIPKPDPAARATFATPLGEPPSPVDPPPGCTFHPRCPQAMTRCAESAPRPRAAGPGRIAACHLLDLPEAEAEPEPDNQPLRRSLP